VVADLEGVLQTLGGLGEALSTYDQVCPWLLGPRACWVSRGSGQCGAFGVAMAAVPGDY